MIKILNTTTIIRKSHRFLHTPRDYSITPEQLLFGSRFREWEHSDYGIDNNGLHSSVLSRNNVGLGFLILNSEYGCIEQNKLLYRRLRDLEVNIYKRYVVLTSMSRDTFNLGWDSMELLKLAESSHKTGDIDPKFKSHMIKLCDLIHLSTTYRKPLIIYANGDTGGYAISLWSLANRAAAYKHSTLMVNNLDYGWIIDGGLSCILSLIRGSLGEYIALTGCRIKGSDLINIGLGNRWISPDAFSLMEHTSSTQLSVSEQDAKVLLEEHSLYYPEISKNSIINWESVINHHFSLKSVEEIVCSLKRGTPTDIIESAGKSVTQVSNWERKTISILESRPPLAAKISLKLLRDAKRCKDMLMKEGDISPSLWNKLNNTRRICPTTTIEANQQLLRDTLVEELLIECLNNELNAAQGYIMSLDIVESIRAYITKNTKNYIEPKYKDCELKSMSNYICWEPKERGWFSLSSIPQLKKLNPDYNNSSGLDHDPTSVND